MWEFVNFHLPIELTELVLQSAMELALRDYKPEDVYELKAIIDFSRPGTFYNGARNNSRISYLKCRAFHIPIVETIRRLSCRCKQLADTFANSTYAKGAHRAILGFVAQATTQIHLTPMSHYLVMLPHSIEQEDLTMSPALLWPKENNRVMLFMPRKRLNIITLLRHFHCENKITNGQTIAFRTGHVLGDHAFPPILLSHFLDNNISDINYIKPILIKSP